MKRLCKHIQFDTTESKYYVKEPATIEPIMDGLALERFGCSLCKRQFPVLTRNNGNVRIVLVPKGA